jgi:hypothetical protein
MEVTIDVEVAEEGRKQVAELMRSLRAYDVMKETNKVIVYDTLLPFKHAYFSLVEYGALRAARGACVCVLLPIEWSRARLPPVAPLPSPSGE